MTNEQRPRMMPVHSPILQVRQNLRDAETENANLRDLLNKSMAENAVLLQQVTEMQEVLSIENEKLARMIDSAAQGRLANMEQAYQEAKKHIDELTKERDEALKQLESIENELQTVDEIAETLTHFVLLGTPGAHNCDQMGCGYSHVLFRVEKKALPGWTALAEMNERQRLEWSRAENAEAKVDQLTTALINIGEALFKSYILAFAVRDVTPSMEELEQACETLNKTLSAHSGEIITLRQQLADAQASHHSAMILLDAVQGDCNEWHDGYAALLKWSQSAYKRLGGLMTIGVSMTPDAVTAKLLSDAPANVSADVDPFSATVDATYSIYTDPLIVGIAKSMECTIGDLVEYAHESVGYPKDGGA